MQDIQPRLQQFQSVQLPDLEKVALLNRMDTKYVFTLEQLPAFLDVLKEAYFILDINGNRMFNYESLYFDTDDFVLYNHHYCGRLNRYKVRFRKYVESDLTYFEIKFKNNKGRTIKNRILHQQGDSIYGEALDFLEKETPLRAQGLKAKIWVNYTRITLVSKDFRERLTIDLNLNFKSDHEQMAINELVIAEVKQGKTGQSEFTKLMKAHHIRKGAISKYCFGVASLFNNIRVNNFKSTLLYLNKIIYAAPTGH